MASKNSLRALEESIKHIIFPRLKPHSHRDVPSGIR